MADDTRAPLPRNVLLLGLVSALNDVASEVTVRIVPLFLKDVLGVALPVIGLIEGLAEATVTLLKVVAGRISDATARRKPLAVAGYALSNLTKPLLLVAGSWAAVLALRLADRVGKGIRTAPRDALLADSVGAADRGRAFGFHRAADTAGSVAGLIIVTLVVYGLQGQAPVLAEATYRTIVAIALIPALLAVLVLAVFVREPESPWAHAAAGPRAALPPELRRALAAMGVFGLAALTDNMLLLAARKLGLPLVSSLGLLLVMAVVAMAASYPAGALSDRLGRKGILAFGWSALLVELVLLAFSAEPWAFVVVFALHGVYLGFSEGVAKALVTDLAPASARGTAFGALAAVTGLAAIPANAGLGWLLENEQPRVAFLSAAGAAAAGLVLLATVRPRAAAG